MIKVGIIGFSHGHAYSVCGEWLQHSEELNVLPTVYWEPDDGKAKEVGEKLPQLTRVSTLEELLSGDIQAVLITCETAYHADMVEKAAAAGKDIICYKPLALTMAQADRIVEAVNKHHVRFSMGWQMRTDPQNKRMREICRGGELGKVCLFRRRHGLGTHTWVGFEDTWHNNPALNRDIFADDSSHPINLMQWIFGMPETVSCEMSTMVNPKVPNDNGVALFRYADGMIAEITVSFTTSAADPTTEIYLSGGAVVQRYGDGPGTKLPKSGEGLRWYKEGDGDWTDSGIESPENQGVRLAAQAKPLAAFLNGGEPVCTAEEGRDTLRLVLSCYLSSAEGRRVSVYDPRVYDI